LYEATLLSFHVDPSSDVAIYAQLIRLVSMHAFDWQLILQSQQSRYREKSFDSLDLDQRAGDF
jgi:hypothetical protein